MSYSTLSHTVLNSVQSVWFTAGGLHSGSRLVSRTIRANGIHQSGAAAKRTKTSVKERFVSPLPSWVIEFGPMMGRTAKGPEYFLDPLNAEHMTSVGVNLSIISRAILMDS